MFEKEATEYREKGKREGYYLVTQDMEQEALDYIIDESFKDGAKFAYNKANEWHYPSKGELPKENKRYLCKIETFVRNWVSYECFDYDVEYNYWKDACGEVIAWKEITLPELPKEVKEK